MKAKYYYKKNNNITYIQVIITNTSNIYLPI